MATTNEKKSDESRQNSINTSSKTSNVSTEDLDQYGVWVKAGPVTVEEESSDLEGFELSDISEDSGELTSEEEALLGSLEKEPNKDDAEKAVEEESLDLDFDDEPTLEMPAEAAEKAEKPAEEDLDLDFNLDDEDLDAKPEDDDLGIDAITIPTADEDLSDIDMEDLEQSKDEELPELEIDEEHLKSLETEVALEPEAAEKETQTPAEEEASLDLDIETELPDFQEAATTKGSPMHSTNQAAETAPVEFNDLEAVEQEMTEPVKPAGSDKSYDILAKIEEELVSIKAELAELKRELSGLRPGEPVAPEVMEEEIPKQEGAEKTGFFDEDEDETIALTGDELDNILNTADITEEKGESDVLPEEFDLGPIGGEEKNLSDQNDIISLEEPAPIAEAIPVTTPEEQAIIEEYNRELDKFGEEEITLDEEDAIDAGAVEALPEEHEDFLGIVEAQAPETIIAETPKTDDAPPLEEIVLEEEPKAPETEEVPVIEEEVTVPVLEEEAPAVQAETLEKQAEEEIEFDLDALDQTVVEEEPVEEEAPAFEEELEEMEISIPEEKPAPAAEIPVQEEVPFAEELPAAEVQPQEKTPAPSAAAAQGESIPANLRDEIRSVLKYMDQLLESLPEDKIQEFAKSEHFEVYRRLFEELELE